MFTAIYWHRFLCHHDLEDGRNDSFGLCNIYKIKLDSVRVMIGRCLLTITRIKAQDVPVL